jgi:hypothetical protein
MTAFNKTLVIFILIGAMAENSRAQQTISPPELVEPVDRAVEGLLPGHVVPRFVWMPVSGAAAYELQVARDSTAFQDIIVDDVIVDGSSDDHCQNTVEYVCRYFEHLGAFEWRVRAIGVADTSAWSDTWHISVLLSVGIEDEAVFGRESTVVGYPNPAGGSLVIEVNHFRSESAKLTAVDMLGREVAVVYEGLLLQGKSLHFWNTTNLARGPYMLILAVGGRQVARPVIVK